MGEKIRGSADARVDLFAGVGAGDYGGIHAAALAVVFDGLNDGVHVEPMINEQTHDRMGADAVLQGPVVMILSCRSRTSA